MRSPRVIDLDHPTSGGIAGPKSASGAEVYKTCALFADVVLQQIKRCYVVECPGHLKRIDIISGTMRLRRAPLLFGILFAVIAIPRGALPQKAQDADVHELERLETVWNEAHEHGDADTLETLWADDLEVAVPQMPVLTKAESIRFMRSGRMKFIVYRSSDIHIRTYENAAVVTGRFAANANNQRARTVGRLALHQNLHP